MKSSVAQIKYSSGHDRRDNYNSYQRSSSPEDRYAEQERSPGIETTLTITGQTMSVQGEDVLTMIARSHEAGSEKNAKKETQIGQIGKGPGDPQLLGDEAQSPQSLRVPLLKMNLLQRRRKMSWILSSLALVERIFLLQS